MLDYINEREAVHILTIEDPIEFTFEDKKAIINQREVFIDVVDWSTALKHAVREDPDIILVGEMRDRDTFEAAIHAAETGHLVFGTIHASTSASTLSRILDLFPADMHNAIRQALAFNLKAIVCQKLLKSIKPGIQRVPTNEIMIVNPTVRDLIIKGEDRKLPDGPSASASSKACLDFTESLRQLVERGDVDKATALEVAPNPKPEDGLQGHQGVAARYSVTRAKVTERHDGRSMATCNLQLANRHTKSPRSQRLPSRPRLRFRFPLRVGDWQLALAIAFFLVPQVALAADPFPRGPGLYFSLFKLVPLLLVYFAWVRTCWWVDGDARTLSLPTETWNPLDVLLRAGRARRRLGAAVVLDFDFPRSGSYLIPTPRLRQPAQRASSGR